MRASARARNFREDKSIFLIERSLVLWRTVQCDIWFVCLRATSLHNRLHCLEGERKRFRPPAAKILGLPRRPPGKDEENVSGSMEMTHVVLSQSFFFLLHASAWRFRVIRSPKSLGADDSARARYEVLGVQLRTVQCRRDRCVARNQAFTTPAMT